MSGSPPDAADAPAPSLADQLAPALGYTFKKESLLREALTHPSASNHGRDYQRLEFLGDAILGAVLARELVLIDSRADEGILTRRLHGLVKGASLARIGQELGLENYIIREDSPGLLSGRGRERMLEDVVEAVIGALILDAGWDETASVVRAWFGDLSVDLEVQMLQVNPKGYLQELVQPTLGNGAVHYKLVRESAPDGQNRRRFEVEVEIDKESYGRGEGFSKKEAESAAAREAIGHWQGRYPS